MWIDTSDGLINLDKAGRIAIVDEMNIHIFRTGTELLAALQFPSAQEAEDVYDSIQVKVGTKAVPVTSTDVFRAADRPRKR